MSNDLNLQSEVSTSLPLVVFGTSSIVAGLSSLILPETVNKKLPETTQDAEQLGKYVLSQVCVVVSRFRGIYHSYINDVSKSNFCLYGGESLIRRSFRVSEERVSLKRTPNNSTMLVVAHEAI